VSTVVQFRPYFERRAAPPLVFVDMHQERLNDDVGFGGAQSAPIVAKCRLLLERARAEQWPVAFVRPAANRNGGRAAPQWIKGFEPKRSDMVFSRKAHSCYASPEFAGAMDTAGSVYALAGFLSEDTCLSTLMDASERSHSAGFVADAIATRRLPGLGATESRRAIVALASRYATVVTANQWIRVAGPSPLTQEPRHALPTA
jgi:nicotinamidase-related amidase